MLWNDLPLTIIIRPTIGENMIPAQKGRALISMANETEQAYCAPMVPYYINSLAAYLGNLGGILTYLTSLQPAPSAHMTSGPAGSRSLT